MTGSTTSSPVLDDGLEAERALFENLFSPEARIDPHPFYRAVNLPGCRYSTAAAMLRDRRLGPPRFQLSAEPFWRMFQRWLINLEGERHDRLRRLFGGLFTPRRVSDFRPVVVQTAAALIESLRRRGQADLVADFALPLPFSVIVGVLGVPEDRHSWLRERMVVLGQAFARQNVDAYVSRGSTAVTEMLDFYAHLLEERAAQPRSDLLSALAAEIPSDEDGLQDVLANCVFFVVAGHETTTSLISGGMLFLLGHPTELARLRAEPALVPSAVEEMLRFLTPVGVVVCEAREDAEVEGYTLAEGDRRLVFLAAANRDPDVFDEPDRFDLAREGARHLAFSAGGHFCLGAPLARLHGEVAIRMLLERLPDLRLAGEPMWRGSFPLRELEHLPVSWNRAAG